MFTGIVAELGEVAGVDHHGDAARLTIRGSTERGALGGSIAVDGISLTVSALTPPGPKDGPKDGTGDGWFEVCLIPETLKRTTLGTRQPGEVVNLEVDVIAKYVERMLIPEGDK